MPMVDVVPETWSRKVLGAALALAFALAGCGSSDSGAGNKPSNFDADGCPLGSDKRPTLVAENVSSVADGRFPPAPMRCSIGVNASTLPEIVKGEGPLTIYSVGTFQSFFPDTLKAEWFLQLQFETGALRIGAHGVDSKAAKGKAIVQVTHRATVNAEGTILVSVSGDLEVTKNDAVEGGFIEGTFRKLTLRPALDVMLGQDSPPDAIASNATVTFRVPLTAEMAARSK